jgi:hypothetical protein
VYICVTPFFVSDFTDAMEKTPFMCFLLFLFSRRLFSPFFGAAAFGLCLNLIVASTRRMIRGGMYNAKGKKLKIFYSLI